MDHDGVKTGFANEALRQLTDNLSIPVIASGGAGAMEHFRDTFIEGKVDACQLSNADISLRELNILKDVIKSYLMQMHHSRVAYPKRKGRK